jgi:vitamin B12 transporter
MLDLPPTTEPITITASRVPAPEDEVAASVTVLDGEAIVRLGEPLVPALLRLTPSVAVTTQGPSGLLTEVRIRGAENTHTLLFIDGIRANDPATGDFARFELLNADLASRIEVVRGPQSALWGSQAIGGVIAINGLDEPSGHSASLEAGSFGLVRASASLGVGSDRASFAGAVGFQRARGIDSFGGGGDRDGYRNLSGRIRGTVSIGRSLELGLSAIALTGRAEFDGYQQVFPFERTDTEDSSRNRLLAARTWLEIDAGDGWSGEIGASLLGSSNRNFLGDEPLNRTRGTRSTLDAEVRRSFATGPVEHDLVLAADAERETFRARDTIYGGFTNQERDRAHLAGTVEWRARTKGVSGDLALRRDIFNRFKDSTSLRASLLGELGAGFALAGSYAEGIAQPTFFDLYGFFPGNFVGNPSLRPERSTGFEVSLRFRRPTFAASLTGFRQRLKGEIVETFDFDTFLSSTENRASASRRRGIEADLAWQPSDAIRLSANYAFLKATQPDSATDSQLEEHRRPRHSGAIHADGSLGRWSYGASLAYVGSRLDREEVGPRAIVRLAPYLLASARVAFALTPALQLFVRGSNLLDHD